MLHALSKFTIVLATLLLFVSAIATFYVAGITLLSSLLPDVRVPAELPPVPTDLLPATTAYALAAAGLLLLLVCGAGLSSRRLFFSVGSITLGLLTLAVLAQGEWLRAYAEGQLGVALLNGDTPALSEDAKSAVYGAAALLLAAAAAALHLACVPPPPPDEERAGEWRAYYRELGGLNRANARAALVAVAAEAEDAGLLAVGAPRSDAAVVVPGASALGAAKAAAASPAAMSEAELAAKATATAARLRARERDASGARNYAGAARIAKEAAGLEARVKALEELQAKERDASASRDYHGATKLQGERRLLLSTLASELARHR